MLKKKCFERILFTLRDLFVSFIPLAMTSSLHTKTQPTGTSSEARAFSPYSGQLIDNFLNHLPRVMNTSIKAACIWNSWRPDSGNFPDLGSRARIKSPLSDGNDSPIIPLLMSMEHSNDKLDTPLQCYSGRVAVVLLFIGLGKPISRRVLERVLRPYPEHAQDLSSRRCRNSPC